MRERRVPRVADRSRVVAHRGASRHAPENTLAAFAEAHRRGARWIEFDVSLLGDGTPVIHHDAALGRTVRGAGPLSALRSADLPGLEAGSWFAPEFTGEPLPTLEQALDLIEATGLHANLEIKTHADAPGAVAAAVARALAGRIWSEARVLVSSFEHGTLAELRTLAPRQPIALLYEQPAPGWRAAVEAHGAQAIHLHYPHLSASLLVEATRHGIDVRVYTVNDPVLMEPFWEHGLTAAITDDPSLFLAPGAIPGSS